MVTLRVYLDAEPGVVPLADFLKTLDDTRHIIEAVDRSVARADKPVSRLLVQDLRTGSLDTLVRLEPRSTERQETVEHIAEAFVTGIAVIEREATVPAHFSSRSVDRVRKLVGRFREHGVRRVRVAAYDGGDEPLAETWLTERGGEHARVALEARHRGIGSVTGYLDAVDVHDRNVVRVHERRTGRRIPCSFTDALFEDVRTALRKRVAAMGVVERDALGQPVKLTLRGLRVLSDDGPSVDDLVGLDPDFTGDMTTDEYVAWHRRSA